MTDTTSNTNNPSNVTSDEQVTAAKELGFKPTQAWVLANPPKKPRSPAAERVIKSRDLAKQKGLAQLNVSLPESLHGFVKELAKRTRAGDSFDAVLADLVPAVAKQALRPAKPQPLSTLVELPGWPTLPGWKRWLVSRLMRSKSE